MKVNFMKNLQYSFGYSEVSKARIIMNILRLRYYKLIGKRFAIKKIHNNKMILDLHTSGISTALFLYGKRELLDTWIVMNEVKGNMSVLDIGANIGYYAILECSLLGKGKVYAFEPDPRNIEILKKNIKLNGLNKKIKVYPYAVAEKECSRKFYLNRETNLSGFVRRNGKSSSILAKCIKLDNFDRINKIDFIRMDVEGYECLVIDGMINFLKRKESLKLQIELHPSLYGNGRFNFQKRLEILEKLGFYVKYLVSAGLAEPKPIMKLGYNPIKIVEEGKWSHGLYKNIRMEDLLIFIDNDTKIVRSIFLEKGPN